MALAGPRSALFPARPPVRLLTPWKLPIAFTAGNFSESADAVATRLSTAGFRSIAIQMGGASADVAQVFRDHGLAVYVWNVPQVDDAPAVKRELADLGAVGWIPQVEKLGQYEALRTDLVAGVGENLPRAVVTNFEDITAPRMRPLIAAGITTAFVECYLQDKDPQHSHGDLIWMIYYARVYGWKRAVPVIGLYGDEYHLRDYDTAAYFAWSHTRALGAWGIYLIEGVSRDDWDGLGRVSKGNLIDDRAGGT